MTNAIDFTGKIINGKTAKTKAGRDFSIVTLEGKDGIKLEAAIFGYNHTKVATAKTGDVVRITGNLSNRQYVDKNGVERFAIGVNVQEVEVKPPVKERAMTATPGDTQAFTDIPF